MCLDTTWRFQHLHLTHSISNVCFSSGCFSYPTPNPEKIYTSDLNMPHSRIQRNNKSLLWDPLRLSGNFIWRDGRRYHDVTNNWITLFASSDWQTPVLMPHGSCTDNCSQSADTSCCLPLWASNAYLKCRYDRRIDHRRGITGRSVTVTVENFQSGL
jgi:hypothetical protein